MDPALPQKLFLMADGNLVQKLRQPSNRLATILKEKKDDLEALEELCLATLSRKPTAGEKKYFLDYKASKDATRGPVDRRALFTDMLWVLINTTEFIFNH